MFSWGVTHGAEDKMNKRTPGLMKERLPSGQFRYRVRVEENPSTKITLTARPDDDDFMVQYFDARLGVAPVRPASPQMAQVIRPAEKWKVSIKSLLKGARHRSLKSGLPFEITSSDICALMDIQRGRCAVSGLKFADDDTCVSPRRPFVPSIDRIDNSRGYLPTNIRLTCAIVNTAMSDWHQKAFVKMCAAVVAHSVMADTDYHQEE